MPDKVTGTWREKALLATQGSKFGCILHAVWKRPMPEDQPEYGASCTITSDAFCMSDFRDSEGRRHMGAFVGGWDEVLGNVKGLTKHLKLTDREAHEFHNDVTGWVSTDYRSSTRSVRGGD